MKDKNRVCELEELEFNWTPQEYSNNREKIPLDLFQPQLVLQESLCTGVGLTAMKTIYKAKEIGYVKDSGRIMGINVYIAAKNQYIRNEIKKIGLFYDLDNRIDLHIGDTLVFYLSRGD